VFNALNVDSISYHYCSSIGLAEFFYALFLCVAG
jgi:hypothetical protein